MEKSDSDPTLVEVLYPLLKTMQVIGLCPLKMVDGKIAFRWISFQMLRLFINFLALSVYLVHLAEGASRLWNSSSGKGGNNVMEYVELSYAFYGTVIQVGMMSVVVWKRHQLIRFFNQMGELKNHLKGFIDCHASYKHSRQLFGVYIILGLTSAGLTGIKIWRQPFCSVSILQLFPNAGPKGIFMGVLFHAYLDFLKSCSCAYVEIICSVLAKSFVLILQKIQVILFPLDGGISPGWNCGKNLGQQEWKGKFSTSSFPTKIYALNPEIGLPIPPLENYLENENNRSETASSTASIIIEGLRRFKYVSAMQQLMNDIYGMILAQNVALIVFMCCVLCFRQLRYSLIYPDSTLDMIDQTVIGGHTLCAFIRLIILFLTLGDVYHVSVDFNGALGRGIIDIKNAGCTEMNLILASLSVNSANPLSFSAGGFFTFSRGNLLTTFSIVISYVIILTQMNGKDTIFSQ